MLKLWSAFFVFIYLLFSATSTLAGGWPIYTWSWDNPDAWKSDYKLTYVRVHLAPDVPCVGTTVTFKYENPEQGDNVSAGGENGTFTFTDQGTKYSKFNGKMIPDCNTYAKFYSTNNVQKYGIADFKTADGRTYSAKFALNFHLSSPSNIESEEKYPLPWEEDYTKKTVPMPGAPEMIYPQDGQTLDLEGSYMFKVKPVEDASGYLFGFFQDGAPVFENWHDTKTLSSNEFALWENNPFHAKFHEGKVEVWIRAYVRNQWTDARIITINLKPRVKSEVNSVPASVQQTPQPIIYKSDPPEIQPSQRIVVVTDSSASSELQQKIDNLQKQLEESQQRQSVLEKQLNQIISWIKSLFPLFK